MKYSRLHRTYDPNDITSVGWMIKSNKTTAQFTLFSRWQRSRSGAIFTCKLLNGPFNDMQDIAPYIEELENLLYYGDLKYSKGSTYRDWTCQNGGYIIR